VKFYPLTELKFALINLDLKLSQVNYYPNGMELLIHQAALDNVAIQLIKHPWEM